jgi:hypothetical protein
MEFPWPGGPPAANRRPSPPPWHDGRVAQAAARSTLGFLTLHVGRADQSRQRSTPPRWCLALAWRRPARGAAAVSWSSGQDAIHHRSAPSSLRYFREGHRGNLARGLSCGNLRVGFARLAATRLRRGAGATERVASSRRTRGQILGGYRRFWLSSGSPACHLSGSMGLVGRSFLTWSL